MAARCRHRGRAAASLSFWRDLTAPVIELAVPTKQRPQHGVLWSRRRVPVELQVRLRGAVISRPSLTVLDLIPQLKGAAISKALHAGVTLAGMHRALELSPDRPHNELRRRLLIEYRHEPWSEAEQSMHVLLRAAKITGWIANYPMVVGGRDRYLDIVFELLRVCIEIDGYEFHGRRAETRERFETDRFVATAMTAVGWRVLRFTWRQVTEQPDWVITTVKATLAQASADICTASPAHRRRAG